MAAESWRRFSKAEAKKQRISRRRWLRADARRQKAAKEQA